MAKRLTIDQMMKQALEIEGLVSIAAGFTDNRIMPRESVRRIVADLLENDDHNYVLQYGHPAGRAELRGILADYIGRLDVGVGGRDPELTSEDVIITNGSQQALFLATMTAAQPGDIILVESPTYFVYIDILQSLGIEAVGLPSRDDSLDVEALPAFFDELAADGRLDRVRAVYLISYFSNPTALSLSREQKRGICGEMSKRGIRVPVIEDVAYREFWFEEEWPVPSMLADETAEVPVIMTGTLTKSFATGLKVGYVVVRDPALRKRMLDLKRCQDFGTSHFTQAIVEQAIVRGDFRSFLEGMRPLYTQKCRTLERALADAGLRDLGWTWPESRGSLYVWATAPDGVSTEPFSAFYETCLDEKVIYVPGSLCYADGVGGKNKVRLSFGALQGEELIEGARRFAAAAKRVAG